MNAKTANRELGTDTELLDLINKIRGFNHNTATIDDHAALADALRILAEDIVERHERTRELQQELERKIKIAEVAGHMSVVVDRLRTHAAPRKRRWFRA